MALFHKKLSNTTYSFFAYVAICFIVINRGNIQAPCNSMQSRVHEGKRQNFNSKDSNFILTKQWFLHFLCQKYLKNEISLFLDVWVCWSHFYIEMIKFTKAASLPREWTVIPCMESLHSTRLECLSPHSFGFSERLDDFLILLCTQKNIIESQYFISFYCFSLKKGGAR